MASEVFSARGNGVNPQNAINRFGLSSRTAAMNSGDRRTRTNAILSVVSRAQDLQRQYGFDSLIRNSEQARRNSERINRAGRSMINRITR